ncbi:MAG TPA: cytochrome c3 family protein [Kofleriaceae bacterium]|nr:cytochrome c3 family protein [Kofleriaceae bacterium]
MMMRSLVMCAFAAAACTQDHPAGGVELTVRDCYECHRTEYETAPNHAGMRSTVCADCHRLRDWIGLLPGMHPEAEFVIAEGPHRNVFCADCHDPEVNPQSMGENNVSCIGCHTGEHDMARMVDKHKEEPRFVWDPARPTFCRDCHRRGLNDF